MIFYAPHSLRYVVKSAKILASRWCQEEASIDTTHLSLGSYPRPRKGEALMRSHANSVAG